MTLVKVGGGTQWMNYKPNFVVNNSVSDTGPGYLTSVAYATSSGSFSVSLDGSEFLSSSGNTPASYNEVYGVFGGPVYFSNSIDISSDDTIICYITERQNKSQYNEGLEDMTPRSDRIKETGSRETTTWSYSGAGLVNTIDGTASSGSVSVDIDNGTATAGEITVRQDQSPTIEKLPLSGPIPFQNSIEISVYNGSSVTEDTVAGISYSTIN